MYASSVGNAFLLLQTFRDIRSCAMEIDSLCVRYMVKVFTVPVHLSYMKEFTLGGSFMHVSNLIKLLLILVAFTTMKRYIME